MKKNLVLLVCSVSFLTCMYASEQHSVLVEPYELVLECASGDMVYKERSLLRNTKKFLYSLSIPAKLLQHAGEIKSSVFSPNGLQVLTGSSDNTAKLWDCVSGNLIHIFPHQAAVNVVVFSSNGLQALTGSSDWTVKLWDCLSGDLIHTFLHQEKVNAVAFSPNRSYILTGSDDGAVSLWDSTLGTLIYSIALEKNGIESVSFSPDGSKLLISNGSTNWLANSASGEVIQRFAGGSFSRSSALFSPDGSMILTGEGEKAVLWDAQSGARGFELTHFESSGWERSITTACFSPNCLRIVTGGSDGTVRVWDSITGKVAHRFESLGRGVYFLVFSRNGSRILSGHTIRLGESAHLWDTHSGKLLSRYDHCNGVFPLAVSSDGEYWLAGIEGPLSMPTPMVVLFNKKGKLLYKFCHDGSISSVAFSPDGTKILSIYKDGQAKLWDMDSVKNLQVFLNNITLGQAELLRAFEETFKGAGKIHANDEQWYTFKTFPRELQNAFSCRIKAPEKAVTF